jgi:hypothetical protein
MTVRCFMMCEPQFSRYGSLVIRSVAFDPSTGKVCAMRGTVDRHSARIG